MKISGLVVLSNQEKLCYPWRESIRSFLPVVDEMVVVHNPLSDDNSRQLLEDFVKEFGEGKTRIVSAPFDLLKYGWVSYGIQRTVGYQACKGDVVVMFDSDGVLHEKDVPRLIEQLDWFDRSTEYVMAYWGKYRMYQYSLRDTLYWDQNKHSGIYHKGRLGDKFDFWRIDGGEIKGAPNVSLIDQEKEKSIQFDAKLFGYEHFWDTEDVIRFKVNAYGQMIDRQHGREFKTPDEYYYLYMAELAEDIKKKGKRQFIKHPEVMQKKLSELKEEHFATNFFGVFKAEV